MTTKIGMPVRCSCFKLKSADWLDKNEEKCNCMWGGQLNMPINAATYHFTFKEVVLNTSNDVFFIDRGQNFECKTV